MCLSTRNHLCRLSEEIIKLGKNLCCINHGQVLSVIRFRSLIADYKLYQSQILELVQTSSIIPPKNKTLNKNLQDTKI